MERVSLRMAVVVADLTALPATSLALVLPLVFLPVTLLATSFPMLLVTLVIAAPTAAPMMALPTDFLDFEAVFFFAASLY